MDRVKLQTALEWFKSLRDTSNRAFLPLYAAEERYLVLKGGAGSGKSNFAGHKVLDRCVHERGHRYLVCRKVKEDIRKSCYEQLISMCAELYPSCEIRTNSTQMSIIFPSGSVIYCVGLNDVTRLKSIYEITDVWVEEAAEITEADFNQLDIRMRGQSPHYSQLMLTFNPVSVNHWIKKRFFDKRIPNARTHESTYLDNAWLREQDRRVLEGFRDTDAYYYSVYCLGQWGSVYRTIFPSKLITERMRYLPQPLRRGLFENGKFTSASDGCVKIYREPIPGRPYVIGADTAGEGSDRFAAHVIDNVTGEQAAVLWASMDETAFPEQLRRLGMLYNTALIAVETNFSTYTVYELQRLGYKKQYVREGVDDYTHKPKRSFGFVTSKLTRPVIIANLVKIVTEHVENINDAETLNEMLTFVRNEELRAEAAEGAHDDLVMSLAITYFCRDQQSATDETVLVDWTHSMWEDYRNAPPEMRPVLIEKWGHPKPERPRRARR